MDEKEFCRILAKRLAETGFSEKKFIEIRNHLCRIYHPKTYPSIIQVLLNADKEDYEKLRFLQAKPSRTLSGVTPLAVMSKPLKCPHGKCSMCPGGIDSAFGNTPQSYTGNEPASRRANRAFYDSYMQVFNRLEQYTLLNQSIDKCEIIIMGGTFLAAEEDYKTDFVKFAFKALNDFSRMFYNEGILDFERFKEFFYLPHDINDANRTKLVQQRILQNKGSCSLAEQQKINETAKARCVALCIETRPDYCREKEINEMLCYGTTRVELGVQSIYEDVLKRIKRGHSNEATIKATQLLKDSFFKVGFHIMPGLPGSTVEMDIAMFKELFENQAYRPDALKIYPCIVTRGTELYEEWKNGLFNPLSSEEAAKLIAKAKCLVPSYCRIMRVQRDIPSQFVEAGVDATNLRQVVQVEMKNLNKKCKCIRCREPRGNFDLGSAKILKHEYEASNGTEIFISMEDKENDVLLGFCRLRKPFKPFRKEITDRTMGIRQLHVYSRSLAVGEMPRKEDAQHRGIGKMLLQEAERIAREQFDAKKILVLSGIGVKEYFRQKMGYMDEGFYLAKHL